MPTIKTDTSGVDKDEAKVFGGFEEPKPGVYRAVIKECIAGKAKKENGEPDDNRPRLEVIFELLDKRYAGKQLWTYPILPGHESYDDNAKKRLLQFELAVGVSKGPGKAEYDPKKLVGKKVRVQVRAGKYKGGDRDGEYKGEFQRVFRDSDEDMKLSAGGEEFSLEESFNNGPGLSEDEIVGDDVITEEVDWDARLEELKALPVDELKATAKEWKENGWDIKISGTKSDVAAAVVECEKAAAEQGDAEEETISEEDQLIDDDDVLVDDTSNEYLTEDQLNAMDGKALMELAKTGFDIDAKAQGIKSKSGLVAAILEAQAAPTADGDADPDALPW